MNWVERRWKRDKNLTTGAPDVWQSVATAIDTACQSLKEHYSGKADITCTAQNGHRMLVVVNRKGVPLDIQAYTARVDIQIIYKADENKIDVVVGYNKSSKSFLIKSDEQHAFLVHNNAEISPDEFSRLILEESVFTVREEIHSGSSGSYGPDAWMR